MFWKTKIQIPIIIQKENNIRFERIKKPALFEQKTFVKHFFITLELIRLLITFTISVFIINSKKNIRTMGIIMEYETTTQQMVLPRKIEAKLPSG